MENTETLKQIRGRGAAIPENMKCAVDLINDGTKGLLESLKIMKKRNEICLKILNKIKL